MVTAGYRQQLSTGSAVFAVDMNDMRPMRRNFGFFKLGVSTNNDQISRRNEMSSCTIDANRSTTGRSLDGIRDQAVAVVDVVNVYLFVFGNIRGEHQIVVDRDAPFVM